jgi:hypothetical protein
MQMRGAVFDERTAVVWSGATTSAVTRNAPSAHRKNSKPVKQKLHCAEVENCITPRFKDVCRQRASLPDGVEFQSEKQSQCPSAAASARFLP